MATFGKPLILTGPSVIDLQKNNLEAGATLEDPSQAQRQFNNRVLLWREMVMSNPAILYLDTLKIFVNTKGGRLPSKTFLEGGLHKLSFLDNDGWRLTPEGGSKMFKEITQLLSLKCRGKLLDLWKEKRGLKSKVKK